MTNGSYSMDLLSHQVQLEQERELLGQDLNDVVDLLPDLVIDENNKLDYIDSFKQFIKLGNQFGEDISHLFAELCVVYDIKNMDDIKNMEQHSIRMISTVILGQLGHGIKQAQYLLDMITPDNGVSKIPGNEYYMIVVSLMNLSSSYHGLITFHGMRVIFNETYLQGINERLFFLFSTTFEKMRLMFKVVECYDIKRANTKPAITVH